VGEQSVALRAAIHAAQPGCEQRERAAICAGTAHHRPMAASNRAQESCQFLELLASSSSP
jgi:hypothetical protein